jgi:YD repeat-containing protein
LLRVTRYYSSDNYEGNYRSIYPYNELGVDDGTDDIGPRWKLDYSKRIDGEGELDFSKRYLPKSDKYYTKEAACETGWQSLRSKYPLIISTTASYVDGLCNISNDEGVILKLVVYNTLDHNIDAESSAPMHIVTRPIGRQVVFQEIGGSWQALYPKAAGLIRQDGGWRYTTSAGNIEFYNDKGVLIRTQNEFGQTVSFDYDENGRISTATDSAGNMLSYHFNDSGRIATIVTPDGDLVYGYDTEGRLITVSYPDNRTRQYHYEDTSFPYHLTGITDENGDRYATWAYDDEGRAILSEHAGSAERVEFAYNSDGTTTVTDAAGAERIYHFTVQQGQMKVDHIEGDRCATCSGGDIQAYTYDSDGFVASKTDWNGNTTTYTRDNQGRELTRTEASGTPQARTITTTWDTTLNKPLTVTEADKRTVYTYDTEGRLLSRQQSPIQ